MVQCPNCGIMVSITRDHCPNCGQSMEKDIEYSPSRSERTKKPLRKRDFIVIIFSITIIVLSIWFVTSFNPSVSKRPMSVTVENHAEYEAKIIIVIDKNNQGYTYLDPFEDEIYIFDNFLKGEEHFVEIHWFINDNPIAAKSLTTYQSVKFDLHSDGTITYFEY